MRRNTRVRYCALHGLSKDIESVDLIEEPISAFHQGQRSDAAEKAECIAAVSVLC